MYVAVVSWNNKKSLNVTNVGELGSWKAVIVLLGSRRNMWKAT